MSPTIGLPPPDPESCLVTSRVSRYKGGTLIAECVRDLAAHARYLCDSDKYRPDACPRCGCFVLHVHDYPERRPRGDPEMPAVVTIVRYVCANEDCGATWRVLPLFLARHLWRTWVTVERTVKPEDTPSRADAPVIPEPTRRRWTARLAASARILLLLFAVSGGAVEALAASVDLDATRGAIVDAYATFAALRPGARFSVLAALVDRLERGIRLM